MSDVYDELGSWEVDGVPLQTLAYNITDWGGSRQAPPPLRGSDVLIPHRPGKLWTEKEVDSRTITLSMWVTGMLTTGKVPTNATMRQMFEKNFRTLRALLWTPKRQVALSKRIVVDGSTKKVTALAQCVAPIDPQMFGRLRAEFEAELDLADPFFYGTTETLNSPGSYTILGDYETTHVRVELGVGAKVTQGSGANAIWISNIGDVPITYNCETGEVTGTGSHDGMVDHEGSVHFFPLEPGPVTLTGTGVVRYNPAWL